MDVFGAVIVPTAGVRFHSPSRACDSLFSHSLPRFCVTGLCDIPHLLAMKWCLVMVLILVSLFTSELEHLFVFLLAFHLPFVNYLYISFCPIFLIFFH